VTRAEAKRHLSVDLATTGDDLLVDDLVAWATDRFERDTGRTLITTIYEMRIDSFPVNGVVALPRSPCLGSSTVTVTYVDTSGTTVTWSSSKYDVDKHSEPPRIYPAYNEVFPSDVRSGVVNPIKVTFSSGYGATQSSVPAVAKMAIKAAVAEQYRHREVGAMDEIAERGWRNSVGLMRYEL
jgi:uncharacterized phiE125 gp8 family phage protein